LALISIAQKQDLNEKNISLEERLNNLESEVVSLKNEVVSLKNEVVSLKNKVAKLENDNNQLRNDKEKLRNDNEKLRSEVNPLCEQLKETNSFLEQQIVTLNTSHNDLHSKLSALSIQIDFQSFVLELMPQTHHFMQLGSLAYTVLHNLKALVAPNEMSWRKIVESTSDDLLKQLGFSADQLEFCIQITTKRTPWAHPPLEFRALHLAAQQLLELKVLSRTDFDTVVALTSRVCTLLKAQHIHTIDYFIK